MTKKRDYIRKALMWRERSEVNADFYAEYECPETHKVARVKVTDIRIEGGCRGHYGADEYCYCPSHEVLVEWDKCPECKGEHKTRMH